MKIVLTRRNPNSQNAESYMRVVFAHISHRVLLRSVQVEAKKTGSFGQLSSSASRASSLGESEKIIVECQPQGTEKADAGFVAMIREAISLRGDLSIDEISPHAAFIGPVFGNNNEDEPDPIHELLSRMQSPSEAVPPRAAMNFFAQQRQQRPIVQIPAIKQIAPNAFEVDERFATFVANKADYLQSLLKSNVITVLLSYEALDKTTLRYTGEIQTKSQGIERVPFDPKNVYHCFAHAVNANNYLKDKLVKNKIEGVSFVLRSDGEVLVNVTIAEHYSAKLPLVTNTAEPDARSTNEASSLRIV